MVLAGSSSESPSLAGLKVGPDVVGAEPPGSAGRPMDRRILFAASMERSAMLTDG
jgi:hypothetical protein